jgi:predicted ATPase
MLTRLKVNGFKNLADADVRFGPFTCIAGANGAGKSNLFDAIHFLSLTANYPLLEAALRVRDETGHNADVRSLFRRVGETWGDTISFEAEMIVPPEAIDDLGQKGEAAITFLRYNLDIRLRKGAESNATSNPLEIIREELKHILLGSAHDHLLFPHNASLWRKRVLTGKRSGTAFISTTVKEDGSRTIKVHQDAGGGGRAYERAAASLPRTVLSSATAAESPTALCVRREMQGWRLLQLEPDALRQPDEFSSPTHLESSGRHLPANLSRLATREQAEGVYFQLANRLSELIGSVQALRIDRDKKRELLTLMMAGPDGTELPARALSDGTLRFLALSVLELDPESRGLICLEEPENSIHPDRIPAIIRLLQDIATDPKQEASETNPLRQVIINTHSPSVVAAVPEDSLLLAKLEKDGQNGQKFTKAVFACLPGNWRLEGKPACPEAEPGEMPGYLDSAKIAQYAETHPDRPRRVINHPEFKLITSMFKGRGDEAPDDTPAKT